MEPKSETAFADLPHFIGDLQDKKVALRYKLRPEGAGLAPPYEGMLVGNDGTFLKLKILDGYQGPGRPRIPDVLIAIDSLATIQEAQ